MQQEAASRRGNASARQAAILAHLTRNGRAGVEELARILQATPQTVRRDLSELEEENRVVRYHGGATLVAGIEYAGFEARRNIAAEQKQRIGAACAALIPNNAAIVINAGTTTAAIARQLRQHVGLRVVTDSVQIANEIRSFPGLEVVIPGGRVRPSDGAIVGAEAVEFIRQFRPDFAVIGAAAIGRDGALLDYDLSEAAVARAVIAHARHVILAADSTKFDRVAPVKIGDLGQVRMLITDDRCPEPLRQLCRASEVRVVEV